MTSFARCTDQNAYGSITWEIRSVNHRYLDYSFKLPDFFNQLEMKFREILRTKIKRGHLDCYLKYQPKPQSNLQLKVEENLVTALVACAEKISGKITNPAPINPLDILSWPNTLEQPDIDFKPIGDLAVTVLKQAVNEAVATREREGLALKIVIEKTLSQISAEVVNAIKCLPLASTLQREKIIQKFAELKADLDPSRLEQEMLFFMQKIDITEELDRLTIHVNDFKKILNDGGNVGKRLDFLLQELNREANTLAAKSPDAKITQSAMEIKVLLEQIREQVQNLE